MKILLAVDGSEYSLAAVEEAARTPWPDGSLVRIVSVAEIPMPITMWEMPLPSGSDREWERVFEERSVENTAQAMARFGEIAGSHGYGGFKRFLLGSISQAVASHAPCSVKIVRRIMQTE